VPADAGARRIFVDQDLLQALWCHAGKSRGLRPQRQQERRNGTAVAQGRAGVVVAPAEGDDAALAEEAMEVERLER
jgi:hypothetical protein